MIEALLFYHPGMWWVSGHVRSERENCCDDAAVAISGDRATYVRALAQLEEHRVAPPALSASGGSLLKRVRRLLDQPQSEFGYRKSSIWLTVLILSVSLTFAAYTGSLSGSTTDNPNNNFNDNPNKTLTESTTTIDNEEPEDDDSLLDFDKQIGQKVAQVVRDADLPFIDENKLAEIETDFARFISLKIPSGTFAIGSSISADQRKAILSAIEKHGAKHLALDQFEQGDLRSINSAYLGLPDRLFTLKWKLHQAIIHARSLDDLKQLKLEVQRLCMMKHIASLPNYKTFTHEMAMSGLNERLADPLCCTLGYPMTDEQFDIFQQELREDATQKSELAHIVSHIVKQSLFAKYPDLSDIALPFEDEVVGAEVGRFVYLSFESNRGFRSSRKSIGDIENSSTVIDATTGYPISAPKDSRDTAGFERWLSEQNKGDFAFTGANGGSLIATRGAKLVELDVRTWAEADAIGNDKLKALLNGPAAGPKVSLRLYFQVYKRDGSVQPCYVGVLTKEGRLAVVAVDDFSDLSSTIVLTRVRSLLPKLITTELSDGEVTLSFDRPASWVDDEINVEGLTYRGYLQPKPEHLGSRATMKVSFQDFGNPCTVDVITKRDPEANVDRVLTIDGEPARLISSPSPNSFVDQEELRLLFGKGTRGYDLSFTYQSNQRQQYVELALAISKSIRIRPTEDEIRKGNDSRKDMEFPNGTPEFADLRIEMPEEQLIEVIARTQIGMAEEKFRQFITRRGLNARGIHYVDDNTSVYTITTPGGETMIVTFGDGKCVSIQSLPDQAKNSDPDTTLKLVISKERDGQVSPEGLRYFLDNESIMLDQIQERMQQKLRGDAQSETPNSYRSRHPISSPGFCN